MAVLDASVWVAAFLQGDRFHERSQELLSKLAEQDAPIRVPATAFAEVAGAIRRRTEKLRLASNAVAKMLALGLEAREIDGDFARAAADVSARLAVRGSDSFYIALAKECGDILYTLDDEQRIRSGDEIEALGL